MYSSLLQRPINEIGCLCAHLTVCVLLCCYVCVRIIIFLNLVICSKFVQRKMQWFDSHDNEMHAICVRNECSFDFGRSLMQLDNIMMWMRRILLNKTKLLILNVNQQQNHRLASNRNMQNLLIKHWHIEWIDPLCIKANHLITKKNYESIWNGWYTKRMWKSL